MRWTLIVLALTLVACGTDPGKVDDGPIPEWVSGHCGPNAAQQHCPKGDQCCAPHNITHGHQCKEAWLWKCFRGRLKNGGCASDMDCPISEYGRGISGRPRCQETKVGFWNCTRQFCSNPADCPKDKPKCELIEHPGYRESICTK